MKTKFCPSCEKKRLIKNFSKHKSRSDGLNGWCKTCMQSKAWKYLNSKSRQNRVAHRCLRLEVLQHYSEKEIPECACCGTATLEFLGIDHIAGGGTIHRKLVRRIYWWLKKHGYPEGFRVLCHNCNQSLGAYGYCPHAH